MDWMRILGKRFLQNFRIKVNLESKAELGKRQGVDMPITTAAYQVLYEGRSAAEAVRELLSRRKKAEQEDAGWN